jgi:hypothetical protein
MSLERCSFVLLLSIACVDWSRTAEIPETMAKMLDILVAAVFGQNALSVAQIWIRAKHGDIH